MIANPHMSSNNTAGTRICGFPIVLGETAIHKIVAHADRELSYVGGVVLNGGRIENHYVGEVPRH